MMKTLKLFMLPLAALVLINCGGGSKENPTTTSKSPAIPSETPVVINPSTLLKDNPNPTIDSVKVFNNFSLNVAMTEINMLGEFRFLKIMDKDKYTLFLGQVAHNSIIKVPLNIIPESFPLTVEIFSEMNTDKTIRYEVNYE